MNDYKGYPEDLPKQSVPSEKEMEKKKKIIDEMARLLTAEFEPATRKEIIQGVANMLLDDVNRRHKETTDKLSEIEKEGSILKSIFQS